MGQNCPKMEFEPGPCVESKCRDCISGQDFLRLKRIIIRSYADQIDSVFIKQIALKSILLDRLTLLLLLLCSCILLEHQT